MPTNCSAQDAPNQNNALAEWPESKPGETSRSNCNADYGLVETNDITIIKKDVSSLSISEQAKVEIEHNKLLNGYNSLLAEGLTYNKRISKDELEKVDPKYAKYFEITDISEKPKRVCKANLYSTFTFPCAIINRGCVQLKKPLEFTGNVLLSDSSKLYESEAAANLRGLKPGQEMYKTHTTIVKGTCPAGYKQDGNISRECITKYFISKNSSGDSNTLKMSQFWGDFEGRCVKID